MAARTRRRDSSGSLDPFIKRRRRYETVLRPLGLWEAFTRLPWRAQEQFWQRKLPELVLECDESIASVRDRRAVLNAVEAEFRKATIEVDGTALAVRDFLAVIQGCILVIKGTRAAGLPEEVIRFLR